MSNNINKNIKYEILSVNNELKTINNNNNNENNIINITDNNNNNINIENNINEIENELKNSYKYFSKFGITFFKIGNNICWKFDEYYNPKYVIGPHWYTFILLNIIIIFFVVIMYKLILKNYTNFLYQLIFFLLVILIFYFYFKNFVSNPGILFKLNNNIIEDDNNNNNNNNNEINSYCSICQIHYNNNKKTYHCKYCNVCIEGLDHHCIWIGKCVGKKNMFYFQLFITNVILVYVYIIFIVIYEFINVKD